LREAVHLGEQNVQPTLSGQPAQYR
jgi:hypothetical protein